MFSSPMNETTASELAAKQRRRREKNQLSCNPCRRRKVKCDRNRPCSKCVHRDEVALCVYPHVAGNGGNHPAADSESSHSRHQSVQHQGAGRNVQPQSLPADSPSSTGSLGRIQVQQSETNYVGADHWAVIAENLRGDQGSTSGRSLSPPRNQLSTSAELLRGLRADVTLQDIIASLPSRRLVDQLIFRYFNSLDLARLASHPPTFEVEYERFWEDPFSVPVNWLSMLFSMMCLGTIGSVQFGETLPSELSQVGSPTETVANFRRRSAQCLNMVGYVKPTTYTVEALLLYFHCEISGTQCATFEDYLILTTVIRVAMRMGYHRDPSHYHPEISVFSGELRRRVWTLLVQLDIVVSFEVGLPRNINEDEMDTAIPRNLYDRDLSESMTELPPSRPESDSTGLLYVITRTKLLAVLGKIQACVTSTRPFTYEKVLQLNKALDDQYQAIPIGMRLHNSFSVTDSPSVIMRRLMVNMLFQKARCVLHRRFLNPQNPLSKQICLEAALKLIEHQSFIYRESQLGGIMYGLHWKITTLATYDFLLAAMILCLAVNARLFHEPSPGQNATRESNLSESRFLDALETSCTIWNKWGEDVKEARPVVHIMRTILSRVKGDHSRTESSPLSPGPKHATNMETEHQTQVNTPDDPMNPIYGSVPRSLPTSYLDEMAPPPLGIFGELPTSVDEMDWALWDNQVQEFALRSQDSSACQLWLGGWGAESKQ